MACIKKRRAKWVVDYRDSQGKRHWETQPNRDKARERLAEILNPREEPEQSVETRTFQQYGDWWLENCAQGAIKASTFEEYKSVLQKHVYPTLGEIQFTEVKRPQIRELIATKKAEGYEQSTIRNIMAPVRGMFFQAMDDELTDKNPAARIGKLNKRDKDKPRKKINPLTREEVQTLLTAAQGKHSHWYPLLLCACRTGARMGELIALKGIDIDFKGRFMHVQRNLSRGKISVPKNGKDRHVDMSKMLTDCLNELLSKRRADALREEMRKPAEERRDAATVVNEAMEDWLFQTPQTVATSEVGKRRRLAGVKSRGATQLDPSNLRKMFHRILVDAKMRRIRFHDLRHTFASLLIQNRQPLKYVQEQMGHSSIQVTSDIYGHLVPGGNRAAVDELDNISVEQETESAVS
jgi:integrase